MKEMIYGERMENPDVLYSGEYRGHKFAILNLGTHPTAYVEDKIGLMGYEDFRLNEISVHGGFTFHDTGYWSNESEKYRGSVGIMLIVTILWAITHFIIRQSNGLPPKFTKKLKALSNK